MKVLTVQRLLFCACLLLCGCQRQDDKDPAVGQARGRFRCVLNSLSKGNAGVSDLHALGSQICKWIMCVSNTSQRAELAVEMSNMLLAVDLEDMPCLSDGKNGRRRRQREFATCFFVDYVKAMRWVMNECGCRQESVMEFHLKAIRKLRDACFSVRYERKMLSGEDMEQHIARIDTAWKLHGLYSQVMSEIRRFVLPRLSEYLPEELHDEYRRRIEPFFDFPSKEEFYEMMHPGVKYLPPTAAVMNRQPDAEAEDRPEVEVEIPGDAE